MRRGLMVFRGIREVHDTVRINKPGYLESAEWWPPRTKKNSSEFRVGFLATSYLKIGGTETFHRTLLPRLNAVIPIAGFVSVSNHGGDGNATGVRYATGMKAAQRLAEHCDVIVTWGINRLSDVLPSRRPIVVAVHHADLASEWSNRAIISQLNEIDSVICVHEEVARHMATKHHSVKFISNAIDTKRIVPSGEQHLLKSRFEISDNSKIVLFGHRLSHEKRPQLAVEIAKSLPDDWVMVIAGEGPQRQFIEAMQCKRIRIVGGCESLADWLAISDCFLSLSTVEGFGLSIAEAMAAGVPTVSTPTGIAPGLATVVPIDADVSEWVQAIATANVIVPGSEVANRFSVEAMVNAWAEMLQQFTD